MSIPLGGYENECVYLFYYEGKRCGRVVIGWVCGRLGLEDCALGTLSCKRTLLEMLGNRRGCKLSDNLAGMASLRLRGVRAGTVERESDENYESACKFQAQSYHLGCAFVYSYPTEALRRSSLGLSGGVVPGLQKPSPNYDAAAWGRCGRERGRQFHKISKVAPPSRTKSGVDWVRPWKQHPRERPSPSTPVPYPRKTFS